MTLFLSFVWFLLAQPAFEPRNVWPLGPLYDVEFFTLPSGSVMAVAEGTGSGFEIWIEQPSGWKDTVTVSSFSRNPGRDLLYLPDQQVLFLATATALEVWSMLDPFNPTLISWTYFPQYTDQVAMAWTASQMLVVMLANYGLLLYDMTDFAAPLLLSTTSLNTEANRVAVAGNTVVVAGGYDGFFPVDITNPSSPSVGTPIQTGGYASDVFVDGQRQFFGLLDEITGEISFYSFTWNLLATFSAAVTTIPFRASYHLPSGNLFVADYMGAVRRINAADPSNPTETGVLTLDSFHPPLTVSALDTNRVAYTQLNQFGIDEADFSWDPYNPTTRPLMIRTYAKITRGIAIEPRDVGLTGDPFGYTVLKGGRVPGEQELVVEHHFTADFLTSRPEVVFDGNTYDIDWTLPPSGGPKQSTYHLLLARGGDVLPAHLAVVRVGSTQVTVDTLNMAGYLLSVRATPTYAYVGDNNGQVHVVDHSVSPLVLVNTISVPARFVMKMDLRDTLLAMALADSGVAVYALGDSVNLQFKTRIPGFDAQNIRIRDSLLLTTGFSAGTFELRIYRLNGDGSLTLLSGLTDPYTEFVDADRAGNVLFVIRYGTYDALQAYDISDPTQPTFLVSDHLPSIPQNVRALSDGTVLVWTSETGLLTYRFPYVGVNEGQGTPLVVRVLAGRGILRFGTRSPGVLRVLNALGRQVIRRRLPRTGSVVVPLRPGLYFWRFDPDHGTSRTGRVWILP